VRARRLEVATRAGNLSEIFVSLQGEGLHAGRRHLFVRFGGCPLRCRYCDTPESLTPVATCRVRAGEIERRLPNPVEVETLAEEVRRFERDAAPLHALAITGGEPLAQAGFLETWLGAYRPRLPILLETAGVFPERLERVLPGIDVVSLDFKCPSNTGERSRWDEHEACVVAVRRAGREVYVKMPVDETTDEADVARGAALLARLAPEVPLFLTPITEPAGTALEIGAATLVRFQHLAASRHADTRVSPQLHKVIGIQ